MVLLVFISVFFWATVSMILLVHLFQTFWKASLRVTLVSVFFGCRFVYVPFFVPF